MLCQGRCFLCSVVLEQRTSQENVKVTISLFISFRLKVLSFMNWEFEKPKKISASKYAFLSKKLGIYVLTERPGTGTCVVTAVRRPSLFYKEKRDKEST